MSPETNKNYMEYSVKLLVIIPTGPIRVLNMPIAVSEQIVLASRPKGEPTEENFATEKVELGAIGEGQVLVKVLWLSLDPYMRGRMSAAKSYAKSTEIGEVMTGSNVAKVEQSNYEGLLPGDLVFTLTGWQTRAIVDGKSLQKLPADLPNPSWALGVLGMPGFTAWHGILKIGQPKPGETVVVAAASGPVGATVGQIAKIKGCRVVGIAGGRKKCDHVTNELGFDACIDHRDPDFASKLQAAVPRGIDVYFENVGGEVFKAVQPLLNDFARVPVCGLISWYSSEAFPGPNELPIFLSAVLRKRILIQGFIITDHLKEQAEFMREMSVWVGKGEVKYLEDVVDGLSNAPVAFMGLLKGKNYGKLVVKVSDA